MTGKTKAVVRPKKDVDYVWTCDYCGKEFKTQKICAIHEYKCEKENKAKSSFKILYIVGGLVIIFIGYRLFFTTSTQVQYYQPAPTPDLDPYINCWWNKDDKGNQVCADKRMRQSECADSVCCNLGNGTWAPLGKVECATTQAEINSKKPTYVRQPIKIDIPWMQPVKPPNVSCNYDSLGNWVCKPSW